MKTSTDTHNNYDQQGKKTHHRNIPMVSCGVSLIYPHSYLETDSSNQRVYVVAVVLWLVQGTYPICQISAYNMLSYCHYSQILRLSLYLSSWTLAHLVIYTCAQQPPFITWIVLRLLRKVVVFIHINYLARLDLKIMECASRLLMLCQSCMRNVHLVMYA